MCPCPVCATLAILLAPFLGYKWVKNLIKKHHCGCARCQAADQRKGVVCLCEKGDKPYACAQTDAPAEPVVKRRAGRPKGSKNKAKSAVVTSAVVTADVPSVKRGPGRPKGAKNKVKKTVSLPVGEKRRPGRPKGAKNKPKTKA